MKTHIVIPIGVSQPGTPVLELLEKSIESIQNQSSKDFILTVASDNNVSDECKALLQAKNVEVKWFEPGSFFRRGGIWKKITDTWKTSDTKYLAFMHYDDIWDSKKLEVQIEIMEKENLNSSWSEVYVIDDTDSITSGDCSFFSEFSRETVGRRSVAQAHSMIVERESFFSSGIMEFENMWSPVFEDLFMVFCNKQGNGKKVSGAKFYWRNHSMNMSNSILTDIKWEELLTEQKRKGEYQDDIIQRDVEYMHQVMRNIIQKI
jgi:hypothetical protein